MVILVAITFPPASTDPASTSITTLSSTRLRNRLMTWRISSSPKNRRV